MHIALQVLSTSAQQTREEYLVAQAVKLEKQGFSVWSVGKKDRGIVNLRVGSRLAQWETSEIKEINRSVAVISADVTRFQATGADEI